MVTGITAKIPDYDLAFELRDEDTGDDLRIVVTDFFSIEPYQDCRAGIELSWDGFSQRRAQKGREQNILNHAFRFLVRRHHGCIQNGQAGPRP